MTDAVAVPGYVGLTRRAVIAGGGMAIAGAGSLLLSARHQAQEVSSIGLSAMVPLTIGAWHNDPSAVPVLPDETEQLSINRAYEETVSRFYRRADGAIVMLVVAHGRPDSGMLAIHRPATCYTAQGFTVSNSHMTTLATPFAGVEADELFAVRDERQEPIVSWTTIGGRQTGFGISQKVEQLRAAWTGKRIDAILVRASTIGPDTPANYDLLKHFLGDLLRGLTPQQRQLLAGIA